MEKLPMWPRRILQAAAVYNLLWGAWVIFFPNHWFDLTGIARPNYPGIWQCVGMIVGVYGLGYWWASRNFAIHWPVIAVGFLGKIFGPIGFLQSAVEGKLPWSWGWMILTNDLIWWIPFGMMLYQAFKINSDPLRNSKLDTSEWTLEQANSSARSATGQTILDLSQQRDVLLVFLRHAGCTFCRETLDELKKNRSQWEKLRILPVIVHMGSVQQGLEMMKSYELEDCPVISDPECRLFRAYQLPRGTWRQLFGIHVWIEGFKAAILKGYGFGKLVGDGFQMSGSFLVRQGKVVQAYPSKDAADSCSWKPVLKTALLLMILCKLSPLNLAFSQSIDSHDKSSNTQGKQMHPIKLSDVKAGGTAEILQSVQNAKCIEIDIHSETGIGGLRITRQDKSWPKPLKLRIHTKGLEQIQVQLGTDKKTIQGGFNSQAKSEFWTAVQQETDPSGNVKTTSQSIAIDNPLIQIRDQSGDKVATLDLPLRDGQFFEVTVPLPWLNEANPEWVQFQWIDFYRQ